MQGLADVAGGDQARCALLAGEHGLRGPTAGQVQVTGEKVGVGGGAVIMEGDWLGRGRLDKGNWGEGTLLPGNHIAKGDIPIKPPTVMPIQTVSHGDKPPHAPIGIWCFLFVFLVKDIVICLLIFFFDCRSFGGRDYRQTRGGGGGGYGGGYHHGGGGGSSSHHNQSDWWN